MKTEKRLFLASYYTGGKWQVCVEFLFSCTDKLEGVKSTPINLESEKAGEYKRTGGKGRAYLKKDLPQETKVI